MSLENAQKLVRERGSPLLDKIRPGWQYHVDLQKLTMVMPRDILSMVFGDFFEGAAKVVSAAGYPPMDYGFDDGIASPEELATAWAEVVQEKRGVTPDLFQ